MTLSLIEPSDKANTLLLKACQLAKASDIELSNVSNFMEDLPPNFAEVERHYIYLNENLFWTKIQKTPSERTFFKI